MWSKKYDKCIICGTTERKYGADGMCRKCYHKKWRKINPEYDKEWREENPEKVKAAVKKWHKENGKEYYQANVEKIKEYQKKYNEENLEKIKEGQKKYQEENSEKIKKRSKKWQKENPEKVKENNRKYREENPEKIKKQLSNYWKRRSKSDIHFKLKNSISSSIRKKLKKRLLSKNRKSTWDFLPYTVEELKEHLENLFEDWMNWDNWGIGKGYWNIDHIKPDSLFNYKNVTDKEFQECWALNNLRPMEAIENIKKSNKYTINI